MTPPCRPLLLLWVSTALLAQGCDSKDQWNGPEPEARFEAFLLSWLQEEPEQAWAMIAPKDRDALLVDFDAARAANPALKPWDMLLTRKMTSFYAVTKMEPTSPLPKTLAPGAETTLVLHKRDGTKEDAVLSWDGTQWFVVLDI